MKFKYFYTDYCEDKEISSYQPWDADLEQIIHSMNCVLHMVDNFLGIVNDQEQTLQFAVEKEEIVIIDIPVLKNGKFIGSKQKESNLAECISLVKTLNGSENFYDLLPDCDIGN